MGQRKAEHHRGIHQVLSRQCTDKAYANPDTRCMAHCICGAPHITACTCGRACGLRLDQHPPTRTGKPPSWDAGHPNSGIEQGVRRPEVARCNRASGASEGNRRRLKLIPTRQW